MEAAAREADVSVATVYLAFGSKLGFLNALIADALSDPNFDVQQVLAETDVGRQVTIGASVIRRLHQRTAGITGVLRSGRGNDTGLEKLWDEWQAGHLAAVGRVARNLAAAGKLRPGIDQSQARDVLYVLAGAETYRELIAERGWSPERYETWLADSIRRLLVARPRRASL